MRLKCLLPLSLPVLLLPYAVLEQQLMIQCCGSFLTPPFSFLFLRRWCQKIFGRFGCFFLFLFFFKFELNLYLYGTGFGPRVGKKCLLSSDFLLILMVLIPPEPETSPTVWVVGRWFQVKDDRSATAPTPESNMAALHIHSSESCRIKHVWLETFSFFFLSFLFIFAFKMLWLFSQNWLFFPKIDFFSSKLIVFPRIDFFFPTIDFSP